VKHTWHSKLPSTATYVRHGAIPSPPTGAERRRAVDGAGPASLTLRAVVSIAAAQRRRASHDRALGCDGNHAVLIASAPCALPSAGSRPRRHSCLSKPAADGQAAFAFAAANAGRCAVSVIPVCSGIRRGATTKSNRPSPFERDEPPCRAECPELRCEGMEERSVTGTIHPQLRGCGKVSARRGNRPNNGEARQRAAADRRSQMVGRPRCHRKRRSNSGANTFSVADLRSGTKSHWHPPRDDWRARRGSAISSGRTSLPLPVPPPGRRKPYTAGGKGQSLAAGRSPT